MAYNQCIYILKIADPFLKHVRVRTVGKAHQEQNGDQLRDEHGQSRSAFDQTAARDRQTHLRMRQTAENAAESRRRQRGTNNF